MKYTPKGLKKPAPRHLKVTKTNRTLVTDLIPNDTIEDNGVKGTIEDVHGSTNGGLLYWDILLTDQRVLKYIFKLIKA